MISKKLSPMTLEIYERGRNENSISGSPQEAGDLQNFEDAMGQLSAPEQIVTDESESENPELGGMEGAVGDSSTHVG